MSIVHTCPECGTETLDVVSRGDLDAHYAPPFVFFKGERLRVTSAEARMIYMLVRRGWASSDALAILPTGEYAGQQAVRSRLTNIRKVFGSAGVPIEINYIHSYGYELKDIIA